MRIHRIALAALTIALAAASAWWFLQARRHDLAPIAVTPSAAPAAESEHTGSEEDLASVAVPAAPVPGFAAVPEATPTDGESRTALPTQQGRVIERESGAGVADVEVALTEFRRTLAVARSSTDGSFALPFEPGPGRAFEVRLPAGWRASDARRRLRELESTAGELRFEVERVLEAPIEFLLVESPSGEPLNGFDVMVLQKGYDAANLRTDPEGRARTAEPRRAGQVQVHLRTPSSGADQPGAKLEFDGRSGEHRLELAVGPRFLVRLEPPAGYSLEDFGAWLYRADGLDYRAHPHRHRLRGTSPTTLRFLLDDLNPAGGPPPWRVWVSSDDDRWRGSALVLEAPTPKGVWIEPLLVEHGELSAVARARDGTAIPGARFAIFPSDGRSPSLERHQDGEHTRATGMEPGEWQVAFSHARYERQQHAVKVEAGRKHEVEFVPVPLPVGGAVAGTLRSESGRSVVDVRLRLNGLDQSAGSRFDASLAAGFEDGRWLARFRFDDVPEGEYELYIGNHPRGFEWSPSGTRLRPPLEGLEFTCRDKAPLAWYEFAVRSGAPELARERLYFHPLLARRYGQPLSGDSDFTLIVDGVATLGPIVQLPELRWRVEAGGHLPRSGRVSDFVEVGRRGGLPLLRLELRLERGWAGTLVVLGGMEPLPNALVSSDGVEQGRSDARGRLDLRLPAAPARLEITADGWRAALFEGGNIPAFRVEDWDTAPEAEVRLERH